MQEYIMALDQGTTSSRCILFDKAGAIRSMSQKEFTQIYPKPGWVEHNPKEIWSSQLSVAAECMAMAGVSAEQIAAIGITNQRETTILWDKNTGEPVYNAIVWQCRRTSDMIEELKKDGFDQKIRENWQVGRVFEPAMEEERRQGLLKGWKRAVKCALMWAEEEE